MKDNTQFASFWDRLCANIIDTILLMLIQIPLFFIYNKSYFELEESDPFKIIVAYVLPVIIVLLFWNYKSATPGKMFLKIKIVDASTFEKPNKKQFIIRYLGYIVSLIPIFLGYLWMLWDKNNQTWHDKMSNTVLVKPKTLKKISLFGYFLRIFVGFIIVLFVALALSSLFAYNNMLKMAVYPSILVDTDIKEELISKKIIKNKNELLYYKSNGFFSYTSSGMAITRDSIINFDTDDNNDINIEKYSFKDIKFEIETSKYLNTINKIINFYDNEGNYLFLEFLDYYDENKRDAFISDLINILTKGKLFYLNDTSLRDKINVPTNIDKYIELIKKNQVTQNDIYITDMIILAYKKYSNNRETFKNYDTEVHKLFSKNIDNSWINISNLKDLERYDFNPFFSKLDDLDTNSKNSTWNLLSKRLSLIYLYWMDKELEIIKNSDINVPIVKLYTKDGKIIEDINSSRDYLLSNIYTELAEFCEDAENISCSALDYYKKAAQSSELNPNALFDYAYELDLDEESITLLEDTLSLIKVSDRLYDRGTAALYNNLGYAIYKNEITEKYTDALKYLEKAHELENSYVFSLATMASIYREGKSYEQAYNILKNDAYSFFQSSDDELQEKDSNYWIFVRNLITSSYEFKDYNSTKYICDKYEHIQEEKYEYCSDYLEKISKFKNIKPKYSFWELYTQPELYVPRKTSTTKVLEVGSVLPYGESLKFKSTSQTQSNLLEKFTELYKPFAVPNTLKKLIEIEEKLGADNYVVSFYLNPENAEDFFYLNFSEDEEINKKVSQHFLPLSNLDGTGGSAGFWLKDGRNTDLENAPIIAFGSEGAINVVAKNIKDFIYILSLGIEGMDGKYPQYIADGEVAYRREYFMEYRKWLKNTMNIEPVKDWKRQDTPKKIVELQKEANDLYKIELYRMLSKYKR